MTTISEAFLARARESLAGAESEAGQGRFNNAANRAYYSCFQAAIAALEAAGVRPPGGQEEWSHVFVQGQFAGLLVNRRKLFPAALRDALHHLAGLREAADYRVAPVSSTQGVRAVARARTFVAAVGAREGTTP